MPAPALGHPFVQQDFISYSIGYAKIASAIMNRLDSSRLLTYTPNQLAETLDSIDRQIENWRNSLPGFARPQNSDVQPLELPAHWNSQLTEHLLSSYHAILLGTHSIVALPWSASLYPCIMGTSKAQIEKSTSLVARVSRDVILNANNMEINASTSSW